jgi:hypothetical protein
MTRRTANNFAGALQFPYADAAADLFHKEDVQTLAQAVDQHTHATGLGAPIAPLTAASIPNGLITSAMIADGTIVGGDIANGTITSANIQDNTILKDDIAPGAVSRMFTVSGATGSPSTTSTVPVDMPDMVTTIGAPFTTSIVYTLSGAFSLAGAGAIGVIVLDFDGSNAIVGYIQQVGINLTFSLTESRTVAAGTHTIKARWWLIAPGTFTANQTYRQLTVLEMHV